MMRIDHVGYDNRGLGVMQTKWWVLFLLCVGATTAVASPRETTVARLEALLTGARSDAVRVRVNDGAGKVLRIGDQIVYRFESDRAGFLTAVHVDTHGSTTLLYPRRDAVAGRVKAGQVVSFPGEGDTFTLEVEPPIGRDVVYAFVSDAPIERAQLGFDDADVVVSLEPQQAPDFVKRLGSVLASRGEHGYRANKVNQQIEGRGTVQYRSADIAKFFGERTRSIAPAKLDLQIQFDSNSDELDDAARRNIDEFAAALSDPRLRSMRFTVSGHTDERGSERHNEGLSRRRAESVHKHLTEAGGVDPSRLEIEAYGEEAPLIQEDSEYARQMNRRVEFMPIRE
jgi:outer membrane protein OmpA-like peptidoglycan-associated protein